MLDMSEVGFLKRVVVGNDNPNRFREPEEVERDVAFLNRCLNEAPKGRIVGSEKNFTLLQLGEHQVVLQWTVYHVGFKRKPFWMDDDAR